MIIRISALAMASFLGASLEAGAREYGPDEMPVPRASDMAGMFQLAQSREVEVYIDRYGREVLVDVYTGEVIGVREQPGVVRRDTYPPAQQQDRYYLDDPEDMARLRREQRLEQLRRDGFAPPRPLPEYRDYRAQPGPAYPEYRDYSNEPPPYEDPQYGRQPDYGNRGFQQALPQPQQPGQPGQLPQPGMGQPGMGQPGMGQPGAGQGNDVVRAPLDNAPVGVVPDGSSPGTIIEGQQPGGLPDITTAPEIAQGASEDVARFQILLDRVGASPGVIDGRIGDNVNKAIAAYRELTGETLRTYDKAYIDAALESTGGPAFTTYEITAVDVAGPFVASVPDDYGEKAKLERLGFVSVAEMLAERFHMDEKYLRALNPGVNFERPGTIVNVANIGKPLADAVTRIVADKGRKQVRAYGEDGKLVAIYPSTIGSAATPSPTGTHTVERVALDPEYTYNPKINFKQGNNDKVLTIPPGPNGPVGTVWIALSKPTYGIHGTPDPSKIGKTESNGCIRLTNWDAQELAKMVKKGTTVEFVE